MKRASVTETKNGLSALLERVRRGETVVVEDRGIAVAQIGPIAGLPGGDRDRVARLVRQGVLRPAAGRVPSRLLLEPPPHAARRVELSRLAVDERRSGW